MNLKSLADKAKQLVERRGGTSSLKEDAEEVRDIARGPGSATEKAKEAAEAIKEPGRGGTAEAGRKVDEAAPDAPPRRGGQPRQGEGGASRRRRREG